MSSQPPPLNLPHPDDLARAADQARRDTAELREYQEAVTLLAKAAKKLGKAALEAGVEVGMAYLAGQVADKDLRERAVMAFQRRVAT